MKKLLILLTILLNYSLHAEQVEILDQGDTIFRSKMDIIENSKDTILCSDFIYRNDVSSKMKLVALIDAAKRGVISLNLVDAPHLMLDPAYIKVAEEAGVKFRIYNPMGHKSLQGHKRYHNKLTATVDLVQTGGTNTGDEYHGMSKDLVLNDRDARFKGESIWHQTQDDFMKMWNSDWVIDANVKVLSEEEIAKKREEIRLKTEKTAKKLDLLSKITPITLDTNDPTIGSGTQYVTEKELVAARADIASIRKDWTDMKTRKGWDEPREWFKGSSAEAVVQVCTDIVGKKGKCPGSAEGIYDLIKKSKKTLTISSPYFLLTKRMKDALEDAVKRGVKVTVITNSLESSDNALTQKGYQMNFDKVSKMGIDLYEYQGKETLHAKNVLADGESFSVGGYNIDNRSENLNTEIVVKVDNDSRTAKIVQESIERDISKSVLVASGGKALVVPPKACGSMFEKLFMKMIEHQL